MALPNTTDLTSLELLVYGTPMASVSTIYNITPSLETLVYGYPAGFTTNTTTAATYNAFLFFTLF